jgi:hypothetical protein
MELIPLAYVAWRAGTSNKVVVPARQAGNRFLSYLIKRFKNTGSGQMEKWWRNTVASRGLDVKTTDSR